MTIVQLELMGFNIVNQLATEGPIRPLEAFAETHPMFAPANRIMPLHALKRSCLQYAAYVCFGNNVFPRYELVGLHTPLTNVNYRYHTIYLRYTLVSVDM